MRVDGEQRTGKLRDDQRTAHYDVDELRARARRRDSEPTLLEGLNAAIHAKIAEGVAPHSITGDIRGPARAVLRKYRGDALLRTLTVEVLTDWVRKQIEAGVAPSTVRKKRLAVLHLAFKATGVESPIPAVIKAMKQALRPRDVEVPAYDPGELAAVLRRVREWRPLPGRVSERRELDVLLIHLVATTGIRHDELARVTLGDIYLEQGLIVVRPKVRRRTREEIIVPELVEALRKRMAELAGCPPSTPLVPASGKGKKGQAPWYPQSKYLGSMRERWKKRLGDPRFHLRALRRGHATALDHLGAPFAVLREALGHTRTSQETVRYLAAGKRAVSQAKRGLATHLIPPLGLEPERDPPGGGVEG